jgi:hypothetical protein
MSDSTVHLVWINDDPDLDTEFVPFPSERDADVYLSKSLGIMNAGEHVFAWPVDAADIRDEYPGIYTECVARYGAP